jgi:predicted alpha/beta superfamily hydrolase
MKPSRLEEQEGTGMKTTRLLPLAGMLTRIHDFPSRLVARRHVDVWCPPGYGDSARVRHPVVYMQDGQNLFLPETSYGGIPWGMDAAMAALVRTGKTPGAIIVGVWNSGSKRWSEYLPQKPTETPAWAGFATRFSDRLPGRVSSDAYVRFLVEELKPFIDAQYRSLPGQADTFVMGSSMGALISLYALTETPQVFGGAGCLSTHWVAGEELMVDYFGGAVPKPGAHKLYFDFGTETADAAYEPFQRRLDEQLRKAGYTPGRDWLTRKFEGAEHSERSWRERVHLPLEFLLGIEAPGPGG